MSRGRAAGFRRTVLAFLLASLAAVPASAGSHAGETKPIHNDHPHRRDLTLDEVGIESRGSAGVSSQTPAVSTRATDHDVVARPEVPEEAPAPPSAPPKPAHVSPPPVAEDTGSDETSSSESRADERDESARASASFAARTNDTSTALFGSVPSHFAPIPSTSRGEKKKRTALLTWGIGGDRVGRPADSSATPPGAAEGVPPGESVVWAAAAGHTALVTDAGALYTAGRNDSAGGGGHGSPPVSDAGQLGRGGSTNAFEMVPTPAGAFATQVACGRYHTAAVTAEGGVLTFGLNDRGQLGRAGVFGDPSLKRACGCDSAGNCACAGETADAEAKAEAANETKTNATFSKDDACFGGWACRDGTARAVDLGAHPVSKKRHAAAFVAAGRYSTVVITTEGDALIWGLNACGAASVLADDDADDDAAFLERLAEDPAFASRPRFLSAAAFFDGSAVEIAAVGYVHVAFLTADGRVFTCDTGFDGYAGGLERPYAPNEDGRLGRALAPLAGDASEERRSDDDAPDDGANARATRRALTPGEVTVPFPPVDEGVATDAPAPAVAALDAGRCHTVLADTAGRVFSFGCGALGGDGRAGTPRAVSLSTDVVVIPARPVETETETETGTGTETAETKRTDEMDDRTKETPPFAVDVAAGEYFTLVAARDGSVFAFGDFNSGQFGVPAEAAKAALGGAENAAADVEWFRSRSFGNDIGRVLVPVAGYQHAAAIVEAYGE